MRKFQKIMIGSLLGCMLLLTGCGEATPREVTPASAPLEQIGNKQEETDYAQASHWLYKGEAVQDKGVDVFFLAPTSFIGGKDAYNMDVDQEGLRRQFKMAVDMEKGIYDDECRFFAPFYRQVGLKVYEMSALQREEYLQKAYRDVEKAFDYYMAHENKGRPIILAGFSQGSDMVLRLLENRFQAPELQHQLVAAYAIGWHVSEGRLKAKPYMKFAQGETDTGVIISYNTEAPDISDSLLIPAGTKTLAINPLNWRTDATPASKEANMGAVLLNADGSINREVPHLTGAYLDPARGALKVMDIDPKDFPTGGLFNEGVYHVYDYQFFYRNLEHNVQTRMAAYQTHKY